MTYIPRGTFLMGRTGFVHMERPSHWVSLNAFCIDTVEPTVAQVAAVTPAAVSGQVSTAAPSITFADANAYCQARGARLATEAEWEFAGRGCDGRTSGSSAFGLSNMLDRGEEWVLDPLVTYNSAFAFNPVAWDPWAHFGQKRGPTLFTLKTFAGPNDPGQLLATNTPKGSVRCAASIAR